MSESGKAVFLSYASQDAEAAKRICDALRTAGVEVWFDAEGGLEHGDEWDAKIRRQIKECVLFIAVISAHTQAREEGYFRIEWELAAQRALGIASGVAFILPVVIDDTREPDALVPDRFRAVQWTRLPGGAVSPEVLARFLKLWSHRSGALKYEAARDVGVAAPAAPARRHSVWPRLVLGLAVIGAAYLIFKPRRSPEEIGKNVADTQKLAGAVTPPAPPSAPSGSEAQKLVAKAWQALESVPEPSRAELEAATELCKRAASLDPTDAEVWAVWSQVDTWSVAVNADASAARRESARAKATKAMNLAPKSYEARLAQAAYLVRGEGFDTASSFATEAEQLLRELLREKPDEPRALLALGHLLRNSRRLDEAGPLFDRLALNPAWLATATNAKGWMFALNRRFDEAGPLAAQSIAARPFYGNVCLQVRLAMFWQGDLDLAKAALERLPVADLREDAGASLALEVYRYRREPEQMLRVLNMVPREWLESLAGTYPKSYFMGVAHQMAGNTIAAQLAWQSALKLVEQRVATDPSSGYGQFYLGWLHALLGERPAAEQAFALAKQLGCPLSSALLLADQEAAITELENASTQSWAQNWAELRLNPDFDPLRANPRFQALLAAAEKDPKRCPHAKLLARTDADPTKSPGARAMANGRTTDQGPQTTPSSLSPSLSPPPDAKSVAVLAFANLSDDRENEYFSDGISEELLNVLAKIPGLKVSARTSAFYFKGKEVPVPEIARQLGVAYVVEGSVRKQGTKVRITAQLIKAADGFHVWSDTFTRELKDIFAVQDEIADLIAQQLQLKLGGDSAGVKKVVNPEAYRLVLEGRHFLAPRTSVGFEQADRAFTQALKIDPQFALAQAGLATTTALRGRYRLLDGLGHVEEFDQLAITQSRRALAMDPALAEPHATIGFIYTDTGQLAEAEQEFRLAIAANPNFATAYHWHSHVLASTGRLDLALKEIGRAEALDPVSFIIQFIHGFYLSDAHRYAEALAALDRAAAIRGESFLPLESDRARVLLALGRRDEALAVARKLLHDPRLISSGWYAAGEALYVLKLGGEAGEADRLAHTLLPAMPAGSYQRGYLLCAIGRYTEGMQALAHIPDIVRSRLYWHPMLDPVRDTPEFRQMLEGFKTVEEYQVARETLAQMLREQEANK